MAAATQVASRFVTLAGRQADRVRLAVARERKDGLRLALRIRVGVMVLVAIYLFSFGWSWDQLVNIAALSALCLTAWLQYRIAGGRFDRPASMALFPVADVLLVALAVFSGVELEDVPRTLLDEERPVSWFLLLLAMQALAYRPWLALWSGVVTAIAWMGILWWMLRAPGAHGWLRITPGADGIVSMRDLMSAYYDPLFVHAEVWIREAFLALICGAILAIAVYRSQGMMARALRAERSRANLARHFSPSVVDELAGRDVPFEGARQQQIGVLFADMVGFTRIAERMSPEELIALLREFHRRVAEVIFTHQGTLDKFIGDCVMATFGMPRQGVDDARRTIGCALAIADSIEGWNDQRRRDGLEPIHVGIGAHFGEVVIGDIGDERRLEFAVLGDTVNVASRLEGLTRNLRRTILISEALVEAASAEDGDASILLAGFERIASQELRNREEHVTLWASIDRDFAQYSEAFSATLVRAMPLRVVSAS